MKRTFRHAKNKGIAILIPLFFGILAGVTTSFLLALLFSILLSRVDIQVQFDFFALICLFVGSLVLGIFHAKAHRQTRVFSNGVLALFAGIFLLILRLICSAEPFDIMTWVKLLTVMAPIFAAAFLVGTRKNLRFGH